MEETLKGTINRFFFQDLEGGYVVFVLDLANNNTVTVKGTLPPLQAGQEVELMGNWVLDPKYGRQFNAQFCKSSFPTSITGLKNFLGSGLIKGIGKVYADKLVNKFGKHVLAIIEKEPEKLQEVEGIGAKRVQVISQAWQEHRDIAEIMVFLQEKHISPALATRIYKQYKHNTIPYMLQNPYRVAEEVWGIGFKTADEIAQKLGFDKECAQRITAGILFALHTANQQGHLYCTVTDLKKSVHTLLELSESEEVALRLKRELHTLYDQGKIKLVSHENEHYLATAAAYNAEKGITRCIKNLLEHQSQLTINIDAVYKKLYTQTDSLCLNEQQIQGVLTTLQRKVTVITGGPGTGKTTLIKKLIHTLEQEKVRYKLAAPTGRAAKRITEGTGRNAATIHRLLEFEPITRSFKHNEHNALSLDFLIVDEASMIDVFLAHSLLKALPRHAHLLLIGDIDQLPSVGAGNFLNDCIASEVIACIRLTEVFRQAQDSLIIVNAHRANRGEFPTLFLPGARQDFVFIKDSDPAHLITHLKSIFFSTLSKHRIKQDDCVVLTPMNRGTAGTQTINHQLQALLNPQASEQLNFGGTCYKTGDRVMQIRNNYDKFVFNGDVGTVTEINTEDRSLSVNFGEKTVEYDTNELSELVLAYAITIHKSQGSEYPAVIIPLYVQHFTLLQRNLIYTAITRARTICIIIGESRALAMALHNNKSTQRVTFLRNFLKEK